MKKKEIPRDPPRLDCALQYAEIGWRVLPVHSVSEDGLCSCSIAKDCRKPGKHPRLLAWQKAATTDLEAIRRWWEKNPEANIGIATGGGSGLLVLDVDVGGEESLAALEKEYGQLPPTVESVTGSGGRHLFFIHPERKIRNRVRFLEKLDARSEGGMVVVPPSIHVSGNEYRWKEGHGPGEIDLALIPPWLLDLIVEKREKTPFRQILAFGEEIPDGTRNDKLTGIAGHYRGQGLNENQLLGKLREVNREKCIPPLPDEDLRLIAKSIGQRPSNRDGFTPKKKATRGERRGGWILQPREILEQKIWEHPQEKRLWDFLLLRTCGTEEYRGAKRLEPGEWEGSLRDIAKECAWLKNNRREEWEAVQVSRLLKKLEGYGLIEVLDTGDVTRVLVVEYQQYQGFPLVPE